MRTKSNVILLELFFALVIFGAIAVILNHKYDGVPRTLASVMEKTFLLISTTDLIITGLILVGITALFGYIIAYIALKPTRDALTSQKQFIGNVAHELRTPLSIIKTNIEVALLEDKLNPALRDTLLDNVDELDRTGDIINNLLSLNTLLNPEHVEFQNVDLGEVVEVDEALPELLAEEDDRQGALLARLHQRQGLEELVERAVAAGEGDQRARAHQEVHLAEGEIVEVDAEPGRDVRIRDLLVREDDVEAEVLGSDIEGAAVRRFHDTGSASGDDDEVAMAVPLAGGGDDPPELARFVVVAGLCEDAAGDFDGAAGLFVAGSGHGGRLRLGEAPLGLGPFDDAGSAEDDDGPGDSRLGEDRLGPLELQLEANAAKLVPREPGEVLVRPERARRGDDLLEVLPRRGISGKVRVRREHRHYFTFVPEGTDGSTARSDGSPVPGSEAARTMPFDSIPISVAGSRLATTITLRPTSASGA